MDSTLPGGRPPSPPTDLLGRLYREAAVRWIMLGIAIALLAWLGILAGRVRDPHAVKRQWAVTVSRVLAAAGGLVIMRLLLVSYEERVPIMLFDLRSAGDPDGTIDLMRQSVDRLRRRGYEVVALDDIIEFVEDRRYVPKRCIGLVVDAADAAQLGRAAAVLPGVEFAGLLPPTAFEGKADSGLPTGVTLGLSLMGESVPSDAAGLLDLLEHLRVRAVEITGREPQYARIEPGGEAMPRGILKDTAYKCFLDGTGFNRFGDRTDMLRLLDAGPAAGTSRAVSTISIYVDLFRGCYYLWPAAAFLKLCRAGPKGV